MLSRIEGRAWFKATFLCLISLHETILAYWISEDMKRSAPRGSFRFISDLFLRVSVDGIFCLFRIFFLSRQMWWIYVGRERLPGVERFSDKRRYLSGSI